MTAITSSTLAAAALLAAPAGAHAAEQDELPQPQGHVTQHQMQVKSREGAGRGSPAGVGEDGASRRTTEDVSHRKYSAGQNGGKGGTGDGGARQRTGTEAPRRAASAAAPKRRTESGPSEAKARKAGGVRPAVRKAKASDSATLSLRRQRAGGPVAPGETFEYTITATNHGPSVGKNVRVRDELPAPLQFVSSKDGCTAQGQMVTCTPKESLAVGEKASWVITVRLDPDYEGDGSDIANIAQVESTTKDPNDGNNTGPTGGAGLPGGGRPAPVAADVAVTKVTKVPESGTTVAPGATFAYQITVANHGPSTAKGVMSTHTLPKALAFVSSAEGCTGEKGVFGSTVTCPELPELKPGETRTFTVTVRLSPTYDGDGTDVVHTAKVTATTADPKPENNTLTVSGLPGEAGHAPGAVEADLGIVHEDITDAVVPGTAARGRVTVTNHGPSTTRRPALIDITLPAHVTVRNTGLPAGCTVRNGGKALRCTIEAGLEAVLPKDGRTTGRAAHHRADSSATVSYPVQVGADAPVGTTLSGGTATVTSAEDSSPDNNTDTFAVTTATQGSADLATTKRAILPPGQTKVGPGDTLTYNIKVTNNGPSDAENVKVTDRLPDGLLFKRATSGCTVQGQTVTCQAGTVAAGRSVEFDIVVRLSPAYRGTGEDLDNIASVGSTTPDPNPDNNQNQAGTSGLDGGPLHVTRPPSHPIAPTPPPGETPPKPPHLAETGDEAPQWTLWATGLLLAGGAGLMYAARRRPS
ncbi:DUF11 domain-containing protein [Streptomyces sp. NPDC050085]|uniref:DUF11 domain-containing protein n=1 Tax=Streptomyces sp. NPDC050085 TaxID=3365600 RepID=UPI0037B76A99